MRLITHKYGIHATPPCFNRMADTLPAVLDQWGVAEIPEFDVHFPQSITIGQSIAVWKNIIQYHRALTD